MSAAVCFDLDGTLVEFTESYEAILDATFEAALGYFTPESIETYNEVFYEAFLTLEPDPYLTGARAVCNEIDTDIDPSALVTMLRGREFAATEVSDNTRTLLDSLAECHRLGVVTNGLPEWQTAKLRYHDLCNVFDAVICSYDVGAHKPDPAPFEAARARLDADSYAMIGDDYEADVEGAREAGFIPVYLMNNASATSIPDLDSLRRLLDALR